MANYAIIRLQKRKAGAVTKLGNHHERQKNEYKSNPHIDLSRTHLNYHIQEPVGKGSYYRMVNDRIAEAGARKRSDSVVMQDCFVGATPEWIRAKSREEQEEYFRYAYDFFVQQLADQSEDSRTQVQRYIRLTYLQKELLDLVDEGRIALTPAVELSYLQPEEQRDLIETVESEDCTPSYSQSVRMRKLSAEGLLSMDSIFEIMTEVKGNQKEYLKLPLERYERYLRRFRTPKEKEDFIEKALAYYSRYLERRRDAR